MAILSEYSTRPAVPYRPPAPPAAKPAPATPPRSAAAANFAASRFEAPVRQPVQISPVATGGNNPAQEVRGRIYVQTYQASLPPHPERYEPEARAEIYATARAKAQEAVQTFDRCLAQERAKIADGKSAGVLTMAQEQQAVQNARVDYAILQEADDISARAMNGETHFTANEYQVLFKAVEIQTGVPATLLKAIAYGEGLSSYYTDRMPRQFIEEGYANVEGGMGNRADWAKNLLGVDIPVTMGDDREIPPNYSQTFGIGIMQLTASIPGLQAALAGNGQGPDGNLVTLAGGGSPGNWWQGGTVQMDPLRAMQDPYYNIMVAAQLIQHKEAIYTQGPEGTRVPWVPAPPQTMEDWALIGTLYQTRGGIGPNGGAYPRILNRMNGQDADAAPFVSAQPVVDPDDLP